MKYILRGCFFTGIGLFMNVVVLAQTAPTIVTNNVSGGTACAGTSLSVGFTITNLRVTNRNFTVQLSSLGGNFTTTTVLATGRTSPLVITLPATTLGGDYRLRVVTDTAGVTYTPSALFTVLKPPTAALNGDTTIDVGGTATLTIGFSGNGPWTYTFTNTNTGTATVNPFKGTVQPTVTTSYALQSVSNICGAGTVLGSARVVVIPRISTTYAPNSVCAGAAIAVPFALTGAFTTSGVSYTAQLSDAVGNFTNPTNIGTGNTSPIAATIPIATPAGAAYKLRIVASSSATTVASSAFSIKPLPTATLSGGGTVTIGETANLTLTFTGDAPFTYQLSEGLSGMPGSNQVTVGVSPTTTTTYTLSSVSNACGTGTVSGSATVTVLPKISVAEVALGSVCVGANISLPFTQTGSFGAGVTYTAQLSDASGSFSNPTALGSGGASPLSITLPINIPAGTGYRLKIVASAASASVVSVPFTVRVRPTATLGGNSTVNFGENATLALSFTAESPWTFTLSDGTSATADRSPFSISVKPIQTTNYQIVSVRNACGEGTASGSASVTVIPRLVTDNFTGVVCSGKSFNVSFALGGVLPTNVTYQAQLSDANGTFGNPTLIGTGAISPIVATLPNGLASGGNYRVRVVAVGTPINSIPNAPFAVGQLPTASLSGGGNFPIKPGEEMSLVIKFTGDAPWTYTLSDNSTATTSTSPTILTVMPTLPITYVLKSVSNTCGAGTVSGSAVANVLVTSIEEWKTTWIEISPNPVGNQLWVKSQELMTACNIVDLSGRVWQEKSQATTEFNFNTSTMPVGTYFVRILVGEHWVSRKIVK